MRALCNHLTTKPSCTGANINKVVGHGNGLFVVLHHHKRIALLLQLAKQAKQGLVVLRVKANRGLIQDVTDPLQVRSQLRGKPNALSLATGERWRCAVKRQIPKPNRPQEINTGLNLIQKAIGNGLLARIEFFAHSGEPTRKGVEALLTHLVNALTINQNMSGDGPKPCPVALDAGKLRVSLGVVGSLKVFVFFAAFFLGKGCRKKPGPRACGAPAQLGVVGEEPGLGLGQTPTAAGTGPFG